MTFFFFYCIVHVPCVLGPCTALITLRGPIQKVRIRCLRITQVIDFFMNDQMSCALNQNNSILIEVFIY